MKENELMVEELMVGDWVICHHPTCKPEQMQVTTGLLIGLEKQELGFITEESPLYRIVEPIPITPQILRKNGFAEINNNNEKWFKIQLSENDFIGLENFEENHWTLGAVVFPNLISHLSINYVHELQHAQRLCGIDKNIEL